MSSICLTTSIGSIQINSPLYNASGPLTKNYEHLKQIESSESAAILSKTTTPDPNPGNNHPKLKTVVDGCSLNSDGLSNHGIAYYSNLEFKKPYIVSILANEEYIEHMIEMIRTKNNICSIELNFACPNFGQIIGYDYHRIDEILNKIRCTNKPIGVKLPPFFDKPTCEQVIKVISKYLIVSYIVSINTVGNGFMCDSESDTSVIEPNQGFGGLGGKCIKYIALGNVRMINTLLKQYKRSDIDIVGVGGIFTGQDVYEMILCGASAVQTATCHLIEGPKCFERIINELKIIMKNKGYTRIDQFKDCVTICAKL
jgi:dihydroorotate dehydrogenase (fumarate)